MAENKELLSWAGNQSNIVTGEGKLNKVLIPERDFDATDLPHHYKLEQKIDKMFKSWIMDGFRSSLIVGAWTRPVFVGGWSESGSWDTDVFNIQTPSLFIDLRFPKSRIDFSSKSDYGELSDLELRYLAQQHCFAGYTLIRDIEVEKILVPVATRHHAIDWNFHPDFPRLRPNRWRIELNSEESSFKEWCFANDEFGQAIYMERWTKLAESGGPHLAMKKKGDRIAILCICGNHFGYALDRREPLPSFAGAKGGGCAGLVDFAIQQKNRQKAIQMLSLEGSYGKIKDEHGNVNWKVLKSTIPWKENKPLIQNGDIEFKGNNIVWGNETWEVLENSFTTRELREIFYQISRSRL